MFIKKKSHSFFFFQNPSSCLARGTVFSWKHYWPQLYRDPPPSMLGSRQSYVPNGTTTCNTHTQINQSIKSKSLKNHYFSQKEENSWGQSSISPYFLNTAVRILVVVSHLRLWMKIFRWAGSMSAIWRTLWAKSRCFSMACLTRVKPLFHDGLFVQIEIPVFLFHVVCFDLSRA